MSSNDPQIYQNNIGQNCVTGWQSETGDSTLESYYWTQWYPNEWPIINYPSITIYEDKMKKAFAVAQKLMDSKLIDIKSVKKFIEIVNIIAKEL